MKEGFEWGDAKEVGNLAKHGVSFNEAATAFDDPLAAIFDDPRHSDGERREILIVLSIDEQLLLVSFTQRGDHVRIISARLATPTERRDYEENPLGGQHDE